MLRAITLITAGAAATKLMTDVMLRLPKVDMPEVDIPGVLGSKVNDEVPPPDHSPKWEGGLGMHYALGALVFPLSYELVFKKIMPGTMPGPLKGMLWGVALWSVSETVVMPILGKAQIFHRRDVATSYLIGHLVYGFVFGALARK